MKPLLILLAMLLVFPFAGAKEDDGNQCHPVNAVYYMTDYLIGAENCDGFDYCILGTLTGTPNGELTWLAYVADEIYDPFGTGYNINIGVGEERISTREGDIYSLSHATFDFDTSAWTELWIVTGGTGAYENATGTMVFHTKLPASTGKPISFEGPVSLSGMICTP